MSDDDTEIAYCPNCLQHGEQTELDCWTEWGERTVVPVYWSKLVMRVVEVCPRCGYRNEFDADEPPEQNIDDSEGD